MDLACFSRPVGAVEGVLCAQFEHSRCLCMFFFFFRRQLLAHCASRLHSAMTTTIVAFVVSEELVGLVSMESSGHV